MQAVVKTPHIEISVRGAAIPPKLMNVLREEYGQELSTAFRDYGDVQFVSDTAMINDLDSQNT